MKTSLLRGVEGIQMRARIAFVLAASAIFSCTGSDRAGAPEVDGKRSDRESPGATAHGSQRDTERAFEREAMVRSQIETRGVRDERVLAAMRRIPRHRYVPPEMDRHAYEDRPLPIGRDQTISQPYIVAFMSEALALTGAERVLEIGTGSGYQAAVLSALAREVYTIEIVPELAERAQRTLALEGCSNVKVRTGDGYRGWPEVAPFDAIILTAAPGHVPQPLVEQLAPGGRMILPVGEADQELVLLSKTANGIERKALLPVRFVPMTGEAERR